MTDIRKQTKTKSPNNPLLFIRKSGKIKVPKMPTPQHPESVSILLCGEMGLADEAKSIDLAVGGLS